MRTRRARKSQRRKYRGVSVSGVIRESKGKIAHANGGCTEFRGREPFDLHHKFKSGSKLVITRTSMNPFADPHSEFVQIVMPHHNFQTGHVYVAKMLYPASPKGTKPFVLGIKWSTSAQSQEVDDHVAKMMATGKFSRGEVVVRPDTTVMLLGTWKTKGRCRAPLSLSPLSLPGSP